MESMPMITPSSAAEWSKHHEKKARETDKQLKYLAWAFAHMLRFAMTGQKEDAYMIGRRVAHRLQYPRDKDQIIAELAKWPEFAGSILREGE